MSQMFLFQASITSIAYLDYYCSCLFVSILAMECETFGVMSAVILISPVLSTASGLLLILIEKKKKDFSGNLISVNSSLWSCL